MNQKNEQYRLSLKRLSVALSLPALNIPGVHSTLSSAEAALSKAMKFRSPLREQIFVEEVLRAAARRGLAA